MPRRPAVITQADVARTSHVYFVQIGKHIKIGFSRNLKMRLKAFQTLSNNVTLLLALPGGRDLERKIHDLLAASRIERELFYFDTRVSGFIDHANYGGLERALKFLSNTTPQAVKNRREAERWERIVARRQTKAQADAYYAGLVAERKKRLGW